MKYFYDTEFLEDGKTIDLISLAIVAEDGREYYAVNSDANWDRIYKRKWLMEHVVPQLPDPGPVWKTKRQIRDEVLAFLAVDNKPELWAWFSAYDHVALCQLFGAMIDLPAPLPMYTHDLRAFLDYHPMAYLPKQESGKHDALEDARHVRDMYSFIVARITP